MLSTEVSYCTDKIIFLFFYWVFPINYRREDLLANRIKGEPIDLAFLSFHRSMSFVPFFYFFFILQSFLHQKNRIKVTNGSWLIARSSGSK